MALRSPSSPLGTADCSSSASSTAASSTSCSASPRPRPSRPRPPWPRGASNPAISISNFPKAYIAFTVADGGGHDVRTAYWNKGSWALEGPPLNSTPADNAGTGSGRPDVAAAGDGIAIVVWGENGHVYSRRVWATSPSVVDEQADAPPAGCTEASADEPAVGAGGDSSFAAVAFREQVTCGGQQQSRVLSNRLHASIYDGITQADGLSGAPADGAAGPPGHGDRVRRRLGHLRADGEQRGVRPEL